MDKSDLLNWLQEEHLRWRAFLDQIGPAFLDFPGVNGDWSMKDLIAHLTGWQHTLNSRLQAAVRGEPEPLPFWPSHLQTEDEVNAWIYETYHGRSVDAVLDESDQVLEQLLVIIESLSDGVRIERIEPRYHLVWVGGERFLVSEFFDHFHDDHEPDVRAWLKRTEEQKVKRDDPA